MENKTFVLRDTISLFFKRSGRSKYVLSFLFQNSRILVSFEVNALTFDCVKLFDGEHTTGEIARRTRVSTHELTQLIRYLASERLIEEKGEEDKDMENGGRYCRQSNFFASFETYNLKRDVLQRRIENAHIVVLGVGGIGSWVVESLARCGVGSMTIIDPDIVEITNLPRCALFTESDIGKIKVEVARDRVTLINKKVRVIPIRRFIDSVGALAPFVRDVTLLINCSDHPDIAITNDIVSRLCFKYRIPHILCGGYDGHLSFVGQTVVPFVTSCWRCYVEGGVYEKKLKGFSHYAITKNSAEGGTLAPIASTTANIHVLETLKLITGYTRPSMKNAKAEIDHLSLSFTKTRIPRHKRCSLCGKYERRLKR